VAAADPTYSLYPVLAAMFEGRFAAHRTDPEGALPEALFKARARLFVIANPNPPLGALYSIRDLARLAQKRNSLLLIDEAYVAFAPCDCLSLAREHPNVVILRTFSKSHALAGMRVAYAVGRPAAIASLNKIRDSYNVNRVSQAAALAALRAKKYYKRKAEEIVATRERLRRALREMGYRVPRSSGNFVFARSGDGRRMMESLRERRILVRHFDEPGLRDGTRITIGTPQETDQLLAALRQIPAPQEAKP
jgi:histidinol-phosphate aminotransferase